MSVTFPHTLPSTLDANVHDEEDIMTDPLWYKDAIIYQLHVKAFCDANDDGIGDFEGLTSKLDYLKELGVNTLWLLPFYPSPLRDDGYDISDYRSINPSYGTMKDFRTFIEEAHARDLRVITELVINHTSDQHPWFQRARLAEPGSSARDFYVWSDTDQKYQGTRIIFSDTESSNWAWDPVAKAYYWHRFFSHQPDLNFDNPKVFEEVIKIMYFWLDMGVDGLRLDAVPYLCEREGTNNENLPETHAVLRRIRQALDKRYKDRLLLAEANQWPEDVLAYFGEGDECHMAFHFPLMPRIFMAVAQEDRHPITDIMAQTPEIPGNCQWAMFLRNHDELTLEMVTDRERDYMWNFYASDPRARINFGIRRRLAPLMENDRRKIELLNSLLFSMPGTPVLYYGDEIGMGDNIFLGDRNAVRTPMQWSCDRNGGFSRADPSQLYLPAIMDPVFSWQSVNVETSRRVQNSLLNWMRNLIKAASDRKAFSRGSLRFIRPANRKVLSFVREYDGETVLCIVNLSRSAQPAELDLSEWKNHVPYELISHSYFPPIGELPYFLTLAPYGFFWFLLEKAQPREARIELPELCTLVIPDGWNSLLKGNNRTILERQILPKFLPKQRWYKAKDTPLVSTEVLSVFQVEEYRLLLTVATHQGEDSQLYLLGCGIAWETAEDDPLTRLQHIAMGRVRQTNKVGVLYEASLEEPFIHALWNPSNTELVYKTTNHFQKNTLQTLPVSPLLGQQTNSLVQLGDNLVMKLLRQPQKGINPEEEIDRFFAETGGFTHVPPFHGSIVVTTDAGDDITIALLHEHITNQGDGWTMTQDYLERLLDDLRLLPPEDFVENVKGKNGYYNQLSYRLGVRVAEMHRALTVSYGNPAFDREPITDQDRETWILQAEQMAGEAVSECSRMMSSVAPPVHAHMARFLEIYQDLKNLIRMVLPSSFQTCKTRLHRDLHLGQVLLAENDFYIVDFEGEPLLPLEMRRSKSTPFKDVAGMIRSFDYAAENVMRDHMFHSEEERASLQPAVKMWRDEAVASFRGGYEATYFAPEEFYQLRDEYKAILDFFMLEKAVYEILYEAKTRPDWIDIPLEGVLAILAKRGGVK